VPERGTAPKGHMGGPERSRGPEGEKCVRSVKKRLCLEKKGVAPKKKKKTVEKPSQPGESKRDRRNDHQKTKRRTWSPELWVTFEKRVTQRLKKNQKVFAKERQDSSWAQED